MTQTDYPVELSPPDIEPYRDGNTGVDYVTRFDSGRPGPHVMVTALVHGNELCGALALDFFFRSGQQPIRGQLSLAFANVAAFSNFDVRAPLASRYVDEDFNRVWDKTVLGGGRDSVELRRARELRPLLDEVDYLLDIHSMQHPTVPLMMCGPLAKGRRLARQVGFPAHVVSDHGHAAGRRMRDYGAFADPNSPRNALLVECGQHWQTETETNAVETLLRFLGHFELLDPDFIAAYLGPPPLPARVVEVTEAVTIANEFRFAADYRGMEVIPEAGTLIGWDGDTEVRTPYPDCVLIMPSMRLYRGQTAVRLGRAAEAD